MLLHERGQSEKATHTIWFKLYDILEEQNYGDKNKKEWLSGVDRDEEVEHIDT